jgi:hypothetical protein
VALGLWPAYMPAGVSVMILAAPLVLKGGRLASTVDQTDRARQFLARYELDKSRRQIE